LSGTNGNSEKSGAHDSSEKSGAQNVDSSGKHESDTPPDGKHLNKANGATQIANPKPEAFTSNVPDKPRPSLTAEDRDEMNEMNNEALENQDGPDVVSYQTPTEEDGESEDEEESQTANNDQAGSVVGGTTGQTGSNQDTASKQHLYI
jgi:hypothetical protein